MAAALSETPQQLTEFSDRFSPVFVKELRQGLRANYFVIPFIGAQVLATLAVGLEMLFGQIGGAASFSGNIFLPFLSIIFAIVMPLTLFGALQPEISTGRNIELLLMSNLSRWQIVRGKHFVACCLSALMMVSLVPYLLIRYFVGDVELTENMGTVVTLMFGNALMNAVVIGASGIKSYVGRVFMIGFMLVNYLFVVFAASLRSASLGGVIGSIGAGAAFTALYMILGLQFGRAKLRIFENPLDPPSTALVIVLILAAPYIVGITMAMLSELGEVWSMVGGIVAISGLILLALLLDRGPGEKNPISWAQP